MKTKNRNNGSINERRASITISSKPNNISSSFDSPQPNRHQLQQHRNADIVWRRKVMETTPSTEPKIRVGPQHQVNEQTQPETESTATTATEKDIYVRTYNEFDTSVRHTLYMLCIVMIFWFCEMWQKKSRSVGLSAKLNVIDYQTPSIQVLFPFVEREVN